MKGADEGRLPEGLVLFDEGEEQRDLTLLPIGFVIGGKYVVKRVLGSGGNGAVYEGEHNTIGHRVAIKVVRLSQGERALALARFRREARICGSLRHPNVGQVYDVGMLEDGAPYMVMELQEGRSLGEIFEDMRLPIVALIDITRQLLAGLAAAHQAGVIHRDIKPDNVMIVRDANGDVVAKLVDFGISKSARTDDDGSPTEEDVIIGSPDYMAPEQLRGGSIDRRTDLYAVGVLLYEGITGRLPFDGNTMADLLVSVLHAEVELPSALRADCPPELERIVLTALSRDPALRPHSADQMSRALAQVGSSTRQDSSANLSAAGQRKPNPGTRKHRRRTADLRTLRDLGAQIEAARVRTPWARGFALAVVAAVVGLALVAWVMTAQDATPEAAGQASQPERSAALVAPAAAVAPAASAPAITAKSVDDPALAPDSAPAVVDEADHGATATADPQGTRPRRAGSRAARVRARAPERRVKAVREPAPAAAAASAAATAAGAVSTPREAEPTALRALLEEAATAFVRGEAARARALYRQVLARDPQRADAYRGLGLAASRLGQRQEAARAFERYLQMRPNAPDAARIRVKLANLR